MWLTSPVELAILTETLEGCPRLSEIAPADSRHYLESMQSMSKNKPQGEENIAKRSELCRRLLEIALLPRSKGTAKCFLRMFLVNKRLMKNRQLF